MKILSVEQMVAIEKQADAGGLSYAMMMENAGKSIAEHILRVISSAKNSRILVLVGPGNNGGDGLVAGHFLSEAGADVSYYVLKARSDDDMNFRRVVDRGAKVFIQSKDPGLESLEEILENTDILLDGVLGTGFKLPLRGDAQKLLQRVGGLLKNIETPIQCVAIDCPSGLDCDTGQAAQETIPADLTITLAAIKQGLLQGDGINLVGDLHVGDIGLKDVATDIDLLTTELMTRGKALERLPIRPLDAHKGTFGRLLIVAGSQNYPGAAMLAAMGAYRSGVGLVTIAVPESVHHALVKALPEATWMSLPHTEGAIDSSAVEVLRDVTAGSQALLIGPGFGLHEQTRQFLLRFFSKEPQSGEEVHEMNAEWPKVVIDADALKLLAKETKWETHLPPSCVLTPHPGEMSVMCGVPVKGIQADRIGMSQRWAESWGHIVVLKGANTVVADPTGRVEVVPIQSSSLAKAGTGDVLAGVIGSLLAQGVAPFYAATLGVYLHGRAGEMAAQQIGSEASVMASEVAETLPSVLNDLHFATGHP